MVSIYLPLVDIREIKHRVFFFPRTAEGHVTRHFPRLPFAGRLQIAFRTDIFRNLTLGAPEIKRFNDFENINNVNSYN